MGCVEAIASWLGPTPDLWYTVDVKTRKRVLRQSDHSKKTRIRVLRTERVKKCRLFLAGLPTFSIFTDHKPLIPILNSKQLDEIENPRLQRLRMKILEYTFVATWVKGKDNEGPDALSRAPVSQLMPDDELGEDKDAASINSLIMNSIRSVDVNLRLDAVRSAADVDSEAQLLLETVRTGFPDAKDQLQTALHQYWPLRDKLSIDDGLVLY